MEAASPSSQQIKHHHRHRPNAEPHIEAPTESNDGMQEERKPQPSAASAAPQKRRRLTVVQTQAPADTSTTEPTSTANKQQTPQPLTQPAAQLSAQSQVTASTTTTLPESTSTVATATSISVDTSKVSTVPTLSSPVAAEQTPNPISDTKTSDTSQVATMALPTLCIAKTTAECSVIPAKIQETEHPDTPSRAAAPLYTNVCSVRTESMVTCRKCCSTTSLFDVAIYPERKVSASSCIFLCKECNNILHDLSYSTSMVANDGVAFTLCRERCLAARPMLRENLLAVEVGYSLKDRERDDVLLCHFCAYRMQCHKNKVDWKVISATQYAICQDRKSVVKAICYRCLDSEEVADMVKKDSMVTMCVFARKEY